MAIGLVLHLVSVLGGSIVAVRYGAGALAVVTLVWGSAVYLTGKGYPSWLGVPAAVLSIFWVGVCLLVPDRYLDDMFD